MKRIEPEPLVGSGNEMEEKNFVGIPFDGTTLPRSEFMHEIPGAVSSTNDTASNALACSEENANFGYEDDIDG